MAVQFRGIYQLTSTHDCAITCVAFSDKGDFIASGGLDRKLQIFSLADGRLHYSVITPSPVKSLIWLSGSEQMLVCACNSGILINVTIVAGDTIGFTYFWADDHTINFMAASPSAVYLATGAGEDIRIWKGDERHDWQGLGRLSSPKKSADNLDVDIILTGLHWGSSASGDGNIKLIMTYCYHGIQLWDIEKMTTIQLINMPSPILGSSLSPNGHVISTAKLGGYDLYSLDSGIVVHTYTHGLPSSNDKYPAMFLPWGFAFCAATTDGTVSIWDVKRGDRLQSVRHLSGATIQAIAAHAPKKSDAIFLATASCDEIIVWHLISHGVGRRRKYNHRLCSKHHIVAVWIAAIVCVCAIILKLVPLLVPARAFWPAKYGSTPNAST